MDGEWSLSITNSLPNQMITDDNSIEVTNEYYTDQYSYTYNVESTPNLSMIGDYTLESTGDSSDRTADIISILQTKGVCRFSTGEFYVSGIELPDNAAIIGSGSNIRIILEPKVTDGFALKLKSNNIVRDLRIEGKEERDVIQGQEHIGNRHGILFQGIYSEDKAEWIPSRAFINNIQIRGFSGGGITGQMSGSSRVSYMDACNVHIQDCYVGINLFRRSEYHKFTNVSCLYCCYGCINNGGNNVFVNCCFSDDIIGFLTDNEYEQSWNDSHGSAIGCTFNHQNHNDNGISVEIINNHHGFTFDGCQFFYGDLSLDNAKGITLNGCNFGHVQIKSERNSIIVLCGCVFSSPPELEIADPSGIRFSTCYTSDDGRPIGQE